MRDVIWTIVGIWVVYKLYSAFTGARSVRYEKHEHHHYNSDPQIIKEPNKQTSKKNIDESEYTDFEEIP